eukprot:COSAG02_NODE_29489_length_568_cov_0.882729_1_plen_86_part_10
MRAEKIIQNHPPTHLSETWVHWHLFGTCTPSLQELLTLVLLLLLLLLLLLVMVPVAMQLLVSLLLVRLESLEPLVLGHVWVYCFVV